MSDFFRLTSSLPPEQEAIWAKCFHPSGTFMQFSRDDFEQSIPTRFEQIVRKYPQRIAVGTRKHALTYDQVNKAANRVAHTILSRRGASQEPVLLLLEYDASVVAALLGTLKAGKFYIPVDPSFPPTRIASILEETQAGLIITSNEHLPLARALADHREVLNVDDCDSTLPTDNPGVTVSPDNIVQILYTSGSTGQPKGIIQSHRSEFLRDLTQIERYRMCAEDRVVFIRSTVRFFPFPLLAGATFCAWSVTDDGLAGLADWIINQRITIYDSVPSVFRQFVNNLSGNVQFPELRLINVIGETVYRSDIELYRKHFSSDCMFLNTLGSSETGSFRHFVIDKETHIRGNMVPVGYAIPGTEVLLLDEAGKQVGTNCIGEIAVKTPYMSSGYWHRSDLTQAAFISDPRGGGRQIYLTGDRGLIMPDGCLTHVGREDFQVKIRGNRVEIAEVEAALLEHTGIEAAVVVAREDRPGDKRLVAYFVPRATHAPSVSELRTFLKDKLPGYMMPSAIMMLKAFPLLDIGKINRKALPAPPNSREELETPLVIPTTPIEEQLAKIWTEVLGINSVGIHDNFLELGGNSLLASQVISRVLTTFHVDLAVRALLDSPTVADMAKLITQDQTATVQQDDLARTLAEVEKLNDEDVLTELAGESARH